MSESNEKSLISIWREGKEVTFPSGSTASLRRFDVLAIASGTMDAPEFLAGMVRAGISGKNAIEDLAPEDFGKLSDSLNWLCEKCFLVPRVGAESTDTQLAFTELSTQDKTFVLQWLMGRESIAPAVDNSVYAEVA